MGLYSVLSHNYQLTPAHGDVDKINFDIIKGGDYFSINCYMHSDTGETHQQ